MTYPQPASVRSGIVYGESDELIGTYEPAQQDDVRDGTLYGAGGVEFTGTLDVSARDSDPTEQPETIIRGDSYAISDDRQMQWRPRDGEAWPDLTDATLLFAARSPNLGKGRRVNMLEAIPVATKPDAPGQLVELELTKEQTLSIRSGQFRYDVEATLASGNVATLARGDLFVELTYTNP